MQAQIQFRDLTGQRVRVTMAKRLVTIPTVSTTQVYEVDGRKVGYIFFRNFVQPSGDALDRAFGELGQAGVTDLVLDLRYNGGGLVSVAQHLGALIGGAVANGQIFADFVHNDKYSFFNRQLRFETAPGSLDLRRLLVITTRSSASASELIINALRPFMPVVIVGDRTFGKPVGQYSFPFCDKVLHPVAFSLKNALGEGDFFGGFTPDCPALDEVERQLGDPTEASLGEALHYLRTGSCSTRAAATARLLARRAPAPPADGWRQLVGAY